MKKRKRTSHANHHAHQRLVFVHGPWQGEAQGNGNTIDPSLKVLQALPLYHHPSEHFFKQHKTRMWH